MAALSGSQPEAVQGHWQLRVGGSSLRQTTLVRFALESGGLPLEQAWSVGGGSADCAGSLCTFHSSPASSVGGVTLGTHWMAPTTSRSGKIAAC